MHRPNTAVVILSLVVPTTGLRATVGGPATPRRSVLAAAAAASVLPLARPLACGAAASPAAADLVTRVSELSVQATQLRFAVRAAGGGAASDGALRSRVAKERPRLKRLLAAMEAAAPDLRICAPGAESCDCLPDAELMRAASAQVASVRTHLASLDVAAASAAGFEELALGSGGASYPAGRVERELEEICEAADAFLDLASGRPPMTARLSPLSTLRASPQSPHTRVASVPARSVRSAPPRLCASRPASQPAAPTVPSSINALTLAVTDMARSCAFYSRLGLIRTFGGAAAEFSTFSAASPVAEGANHMHINLLAAPAYEPPPPQPDAPGGWGRAVFYVGDVDALHARLAATAEEGDAAIPSPRDAPWGERCFHVRDPDGHELSFATPDYAHPRWGARRAQA